MGISYQALNSFFSSLYLFIYMLVMINLFRKYKPNQFDLLINSTIILYLLYFTFDFATDIRYLIIYNDQNIKEEDFLSDSQQVHLNQ